MKIIKNNENRLVKGGIDYSALYRGSRLLLSAGKREVPDSNANEDETDTGDGAADASFAEEFTSWVKDNDWVRTHKRSGTITHTTQKWAVMGVDENSTGVFAGKDGIMNEGKKSLLTLDNAYVENGVLKLAIKHEDHTVSGPWNSDNSQILSSEYTSALVCNTEKFFGFGRLDIKMKFPTEIWQKVTLWATTSVMTKTFTDAETEETDTINYSYEFDVAEYTAADSSQGRNNTSRGMWCWANTGTSPSLSTNQMYIDRDGVKHSYSRGKWWRSSSNYKWYNLKTPISFDGNRVKDGNRYLFITNPLMSTDEGLDRTELTAVTADGSPAEIADGRFSTTGHFIGDGSVKSKLTDINGFPSNFSMGDWHVWSVEIGYDTAREDFFIRYLCDGVEYWRKWCGELEDLTFDETIRYGLIITASRVANTHKYDVEAEIDYVRFTPGVMPE